MATVINDLVTKFSFQGSVRPLDEYNAQLGGSVKLLAGVVAGMAASAAAFSVWANGVLSGVDALSALSRESGVAVGKIQELNYIAGQTQSSLEAVESTVRGLADTIGKAAQQGSEDFARLGISVRGANGQIKSADTVLGEVGQRFRALGLSMQEQRHFAQALGIDPSLLQMMNKTGEELAGLRDRARELGVLTEEQTKQAALYKQSLNSLWFGLNSVKQLVAIGVAPELSRLADGFTQLIADNKDWIVGGIQFTVKWIGNLLAAFNRLLPVFAAIGVAFGVMKIAALGFGGVMGIILSPVVLITAGIVALLAIVDDLIVAFQGGNSVIAKFFKETFDVDIVKEMTAAFEYLMTYGINPIIDGFKKMWEYYLRIIQAVKSGGGKLAGFLGFGDEEITPGSDTPPAWAIPPGAGSQAQSIVDNRRVEQRNTIEIRTADPEAAGRAVGDTLQRQLDNANTQLLPGGR